MDQYITDLTGAHIAIALFVFMLVLVLALVYVSVKSVSNKKLRHTIEMQQRVIDIQKRNLNACKQSMTKLERVANVDLLTGVLSRRAVNNALNRLVGLLPRNHDRRHHAKLDSLSLLFIDVDFFKKVNDIYGHDVGDDVLKEVSRAIKKILRDTDLIGRWGGEEFIVALPNTSIGEAKDKAEAVRKAISALTYNQPELKTTLSIGVVSTEVWTKVQDLIKLADKALYEAKKTGRNRVCMA